MADNDTWFRCDVGERAGVLTITTSLSGAPLERTFAAIDNRLAIRTSLSGKATPPTMFIMPLSKRLVVTTTLRADPFTEHVKSNWVGWSKIGEMTFRQDLTNDSGYKPMSWRGIVYSILKLGKNPIVYGSGGVTMMVPVSDPAPTFGFVDIIKHGIKNKDAVCGSDKKHYFIDRKGCLWTLTSEGVKELGYEEFLHPLVDPVMFYDGLNDRVYISTNTEGYILTDRGLGGGYAGITGVNDLVGTVVYASPDTLTTPEPFHIVTDILDFGYRGMKTIESIQLGTDCTSPLMVAIDYRYQKDQPFQTSPFKLANREGVAYPKAAGVDLRIRIKSTEYVYFELDYINIQYKVTDVRYVRGQHGVFNGN